MDHNWMFTDFIKAHDGPILSRLKKIIIESDYIVVTLGKAA